MESYYNFFEGDFPELNDMDNFFIDMNLNIRYSLERKKAYELFQYLIDRDYKKTASDLWDNVIRQNFNVKPN